MDKDKKKEITVIGASVLDVLAGPVDSQIFTTGSQPMDYTTLSFGGDALNEAVVLSKLEKNVELISKVGDDEAGRRILDFLAQNYLSTKSVQVEKNLATGVNIVLVDKIGERYFLTNPNGSLRKLGEADIEPYFGGMADIVSFASIFVSPLMDIPAMERIFRRIKEKPGRMLVTDTTKAKHGETLEDLKGLLPYIDYFLINEAEIQLLTGESDAHANLEMLLCSGASCVVLKRGSEGCIIKNADEEYNISAYPVSKTVDTTGAGDCFAAGFLWGLSQGLSLQKCGCFACAVASCCVECAGATDGISSLDEVMGRYRSLCHI